MQKRGTWLRAGLTGAAAGAVNGLFGAGGGMLMLPLLHRLTDLREHEAFACSVCTMLPLSVVSLVVYWLRGGEFLTAALPYLAGGALGGMLGMLAFRHKTKHKSFVIGMPLLLLLNIVCIAGVICLAMCG